MNRYVLTSVCNICGAERPDISISKIVKPLIVSGAKIGNQNIRYCNDNPTCVKGAETYNFVKDEFGRRIYD